MSFKEEVLRIVSCIPEGKVATYSQIAALSGSPRAARQVGLILSTLGLAENKIPWWRVISKSGYISIRGHIDPNEKNIQKLKLIEDNVKVGNDFLVDIDRYIWMPISSIGYQKDTQG